METTVRILVAFGLTLLLVMLRLESQRFGTAEYDEPVAGRRTSIWTRLSWALLGIVGVVAILFIHPAPGIDLFLTVGDLAGGIFLGIVLALAGAAQAAALAWYHYHHLRLPDASDYPAAVGNEIVTAFLDEAVFRGALLGFLVFGGLDPNLAILTQAIVYTLATRLGAPGRDRYMFLLSIMVGLIGGWATLTTGGIGASFLGHAVTRVAVFLVTGHSGQPAPSGRESEDVERRRRTPDGWRAVSARDGARESGRDR